MLKFAFKNMFVKKVKIFLIILSIVISSSVAILAYNVAEQVDDGLVNTSTNYPLIIGPAGSSTQLAMNTLFFTDKPLGTISYNYVTELEQDSRTTTVIPFAMGDSFNASKIVGTKPAFLDGKELADGKMFGGVYDAVIGSAVAKKYSLKIGDEMITSHGLSETGEKHAANPLTVTGILKETSTAYDNVVFTDIETIWAVHSHEEHEEDEENENTENTENTEETEENVLDASSIAGAETEDTENGENKDGAGAPMGHTVVTPGKDEQNEEESGEEHGEDEEDEDHEDHVEEGTVCAILVKSKNPSQTDSLKIQYSQNSDLLTITPSEVVREIRENVDLSRTIVSILCVVIMIMNIFVISTITILNMYDSQKEIALMRLIGIGTSKVNLLFLIQNAFAGLISTVISFGISRLCLSLMGDIVSSMGIVLNVKTVYPLEYAIMLAVFVISVLPTFICTVVISKKDIIRN